MYEFHQKVLFKHCDPAGIVFFPRYYEMVNDCVEAFFADVLDWPFEAMHGAGAVPTRAIDTEFLAPSRHGDALVLEMRITALGRTSGGYGIVRAALGKQGSPTAPRWSMWMRQAAPMHGPHAWPRR